jgi:hypothetical protein
LSALLLIAVTLVGLHVAAYTTLSPIDELQHIDYMIKASRGELVARGDKVGQEAMRNQACRGIDAPNITPPPCDSESFDPATQFQETGTNTAAIHPPVYYFITGVAARAADLILPSDSIVTTGRLFGAIWLGAGLGVLWLLLAEFEVPILARLIVGSLALTLPSAVHGSVTITPDATSLLAGGAVLWLVLRYERGAAPWWSVLVGALIAVTLKATNVMGVGAALLYAVLRSISAKRRERLAAEPPSEDAHPAATVPSARRSLMAAGLLLVGSLLAAVAWLSVKALITELPASSDPQIVNYHIDSLDADLVIRSIGDTMSPGLGYVPAVIGGSASTVMLAVATWILVGAAIGVALEDRTGSRRSALAVAAIAMLVLGGPLFVIVNFVLSGIAAPGIPGRYALSVVPALAVVLGTALRKRSTMAAVGTLSAIAVLRLLVELVPAVIA